MKRLFVLILLVAVTSSRADFASDFAVVMIDDETEARLGPFPYDRSVYAKAIEACARYKAKAVVLKFFFDEAKSAAGDTALRDAMKTIPVVLQARLETTEATALGIPTKFQFGSEKLASAMQGDRGWIPLPGLMAVAADIGFVDFADANISLVEGYQGKSYKSLVLCCLEHTSGKPARVGTHGRIFIGDDYLPVDAANVYHGTLNEAAPLRPVSLARLLTGDVTENELAGRVVIIGWDSPRTPMLPTPYGPMRIHQIFLRCLADSYRTLKAHHPTTLPPAPAP